VTITKTIELHTYCMFLCFLLIIALSIEKKDLTDTLTNGDIHFIAYFSCNCKTFNSKYSCCTLAMQSHLHIIEYSCLIKAINDIPHGKGVSRETSKPSHWWPWVV